uniref:Uncharacterized protein n=1 Tax=Ixodes ricinus TaxID=34613 RepID=A0A6B0U2T1_IXORI
MALSYWFVAVTVGNCTGWDRSDTVALGLKFSWQAHSQAPVIPLKGLLAIITEAVPQLTSKKTLAQYFRLVK